MVDGIVEATGDRALALGSLDALLRMHVAVHARDRIFVHAGVVGHRDRAIVLPSPTMTGKTTLVAALVQAGAVYYSDEYAVLDERGLVHPYAKPLSIRGADYYSDVYAADAERGAAELAATERAVESLGGAAGAAPLPVGLIAITRYRPGAVFRPRQCSAGEGSLALLSNTVPARERPAEALAVIARAVEKALVLDGERGDAAEAASVLLAKAAESAHA